MRKNKEIKCTCPDCKEPASFFHTRCCNAHMEGKITEKGEFQVVCEKCNKFVATLINPNRDITNEDAKILIDYIDWLEKESNISDRLKSQKDIAERLSKAINTLEKLTNLSIKEESVKEEL